jgi:PHP family Zn ribbon phosphoesterase
MYSGKIAVPPGGGGKYRKTAKKSDNIKNEDNKNISKFIKIINDL